MWNLKKTLTETADWSWGIDERKEWAKTVKEYKLPIIRWIHSEDLMYSLVSIVKSTILYTVAEHETYITQGKMVTIWGNRSELPGKPKNTEVGSLFILQGDLPTPGSKQGSPALQAELYQLSYQLSLFLRISSVQSLSRVWLLVTPGTAARRKYILFSFYSLPSIVLQIVGI